MPISALIHQVFGHFQNLNLLALLHDLQSSEIAHHAWSSSGRLCPVAHGLPAGTKVRELTRLGQAANLDVGCDFAAQCLGANPNSVLRFVRLWDEGAVSPEWVLRQLEAMWAERLEDAKAMQQILRRKPASEEASFRRHSYT